jgi:hypothetical protein
VVAWFGACGTATREVSLTAGVAALVSRRMLANFLNILRLFEDAPLTWVAQQI